MSFATFKKNNTADKNIDLETGEQDGLSATLKQISSMLAEFTRLVSQISKQEVILGTKRDNPFLRDKVDDMMTNCQSTHSKLLENLDYLDDIISNPINNDNSSVNNKELMTIKFSKDLLRQQVQDVYKNYLLIVRSYNEKINSALVQEQYDKTLKMQDVKKTSVTNDINDKTPLLGNSEYQTYQQNPEQDQQQLQIQKPIKISESSLQYHSDLIQQRDNAITSIAQGVQDVNKIFKDLDQMVNQQGEQIDSIENNMISYATNNQLASHELIKADNYQKSKRKWTCILLFALIIILLIFLAVIS